MSGFFWNALTVFLGVVAVGSFMMGVARVQPEEAQTTWANWLRYIAPAKRYLRWVGFVVASVAMFIAGTIYQQREDAAQIEEMHRVGQQNGTAYSADLEQRNKLIGQLRTTIDSMKQQADMIAMTASPKLRLTDIERWRLAKNYRSQTIPYIGDQRGCEAYVYGKPGSASSSQVWENCALLRRHQTFRPLDFPLDEASSQME